MTRLFPTGTITTDGTPWEVAHVIETTAPPSAALHRWWLVTRGITYGALTLVVVASSLVDWVRSDSPGTSGRVITMLFGSVLAIEAACRARTPSRSILALFAVILVVSFGWFAAVVVPVSEFIRIKDLFMISPVVALSGAMLLGPLALASTRARRTPTHDGDTRLLVATGIWTATATVIELALEYPCDGMGIMPDGSRGPTNPDEILGRWMLATVLAPAIAVLVLCALRDLQRSRWLKAVYTGQVAGWRVVPWETSAVSLYPYVADCDGDVATRGALIRTEGTPTEPYRVVRSAIPVASISTSLARSQRVLHRRAALSATVALAMLYPLWWLASIVPTAR